MTALQGTRILELAESVSGEYCGKLLSDFGAEVIKIEKPGCGSPTRRMGPFHHNDTEQLHSGLFAYLNTSKRSVELDLSTEIGQSALQEILGNVDAVIDDHDAEWLQIQKLDATSAQRDHPALVVCSISNFGLNPPEDRRHSEDINVFHSSGWGYHTPTGADPRMPPLNGPGRFLPSYEAGIDAAICTVSALYERTQSRLGQFIEISKQEVLTSRMDYVLAQMVGGDMDVSTSRNTIDLAGPAGIFPCKDGYIYIWLSTTAHWEGLRQLLDSTEWMADFPPDWLERGCTQSRVALCRKHLTEWLKTQHKQNAAAKAQKLGVTLVAVNNAQDLVASPQHQFRKFFVELELPAMGATRFPTVPYLMSATPAKPSSPPPLLGQDNNYDLRAKTYSQKEDAL